MAEAAVGVVAAAAAHNTGACSASKGGALSASLEDAAQDPVVLHALQQLRTAPCRKSSSSTPTALCSLKKSSSTRMRVLIRLSNIALVTTTTGLILVKPVTPTIIAIPRAEPIPIIITTTLYGELDKP
jgi:hypothetical protein